MTKTSRLPRCDISNNPLRNGLYGNFTSCVQNDLYNIAKKDPTIISIISGTTLGLNSQNIESISSLDYTTLFKENIESISSLDYTTLFKETLYETINSLYTETIVSDMWATTGTSLVIENKQSTENLLNYSTLTTINTKGPVIIKTTMLSSFKTTKPLSTKTATSMLQQTTFSSLLSTIDPNLGNNENIDSNITLYVLIGLFAAIVVVLAIFGQLYNSKRFSKRLGRRNSMSSMSTTQSVRKVTTIRE